MIYCFGDSHVSIFSGKDGVIPLWEAHKPNTWDKTSQFKTYRLGPFLVYSIGREDHRGRKMLFEALKEVPNNSYILLIFGEIDCRIHLFKQANLQKRSLQDVAVECVKKYLVTAAKISELGHKVIVFGGIPNSIQTTTSKLFDISIRHECLKTQIQCLSICDKLIDENCKIRDGKYYIDGHHLSQKTMPFILEKLNGIS